MAKANKQRVFTGASVTHATTPAIPITAASLVECLALSGRTHDLARELLDAFQASIAVERFILPEYVDETHAGLRHSRAELGALVNAVNEKVLRKIHALVDCSTVLQAQLSIDVSSSPAALALNPKRAPIPGSAAAVHR